MKRTIIFSVVAGILALFNGVIAEYISPAFRLPDSLADEVTEKIDTLNFKTTENTNVFVEEVGVVTRVVDGDTVEVAFPGGEMALVRYIGIDTPERENETNPQECFYTEATKRNAELVLNKSVRLVRDVSATDQYGRLLRYVYVGDDLINQRLVREGYALAITYPPDVVMVNELRGAESEARADQVGLWSVCNK